MANEKNICPAISIIIPLYNAERYVGECLDSILAQTFQDFELIVVDDCSTDNSVALVESYAPKFDGRLHIVNMDKNTGSGTEPRSLGLTDARGEYVYLMDNDDALTETALEELYTIAKKYDADVVHCEKFYSVPENLWHSDAYRKRMRPYTYLTGEKIFVTAPLIWQNNFEERIKFFAQRKLIWNYWVQLIRRDFIAENAIKLVGVMADDMIFTMCELCCAKKYVVVPNVVYFYRLRENSLIHKDVDVAKQLNSWATMLREGVRYFDAFANKSDFLTQRPDLKYMLLETFVEEMIKYLTLIYAKVPAHELNEILRPIFAEGNNTALTTFLFNKLNVYRLQLIQAQSENARLEREFVRLKSQVEKIAAKLRQE